MQLSITFYLFFMATPISRESMFQKNPGWFLDITLLIFTLLQASTNSVLAV